MDMVVQMNRNGMKLLPGLSDWIDPPPGLSLKPKGKQLTPFCYLWIERVTYSKSLISFKKPNCPMACFLAIEGMVKSFNPAD